MTGENKTLNSLTLADEVQLRMKTTDDSTYPGHQSLHSEDQSWVFRQPLPLWSP